MRVRSVCWVLFGLLCLTACGAAPPPATSVVLPAGWQTVKKAGVALALPPHWEVIAPEDNNFANALDEVVRQNPRLKTVADQARKAAAGGQIKLFAFDLAPEDALPNFTNELSIGVADMDRGYSTDEVAVANEQELRANGFTKVSRTIASMGGQNVARLSSNLEIKDTAGEPLSLAVEQYIVVKGRQQHVLTFTTVVEQRQQMQPIFDKIAGTFRVE
jgi:hypothetical protein